jgi:adenylate kinase family enzyme
MPTSTNFRIQVVGTSGSGKSTLAHRLAEELNLKHLELDSTYHQPGWTPLPDNEFKARVADFALADDWVIDGNYKRLREILDQRITHLIWLDYPRWFVMQRLIRRTIWRAVSRKELWNGNRESARSWLKTDPEENVLLWAWTTHATNRTRYRQLFVELPNVVKIRIGSPFQVNRLLRSLSN